MSGPKRNPDKLNTIGVVVVGICGAVLVYVSIVALQAFYMNDTSEIQTMADYGGQDITAKSIRTQQVENISVYAPNPAPTAPGAVQSFRVPIDRAIKLVVESAKSDPSLLVPTQGRADKATIEPIFGRPKPIAPPAGAAPPAGEGAGSAAVTVPLAPTGGQGPGGGAPPGPQGEGAQGAAPAKAPPPAKEGAPAKPAAKESAPPAKPPAPAPAKQAAPKSGAQGSAAKGHAP
jgi:hypothetical protein